jgi:hypothetical protein
MAFDSKAALPKSFEQAILASVDHSGLFPHWSLGGVEFLVLQVGISSLVARVMSNQELPVFDATAGLMLKYLVSLVLME